jgi:hypothetical protein
MTLDYPTPRYSFLAFQFARLLDQGCSATIDETHERIQDGSLLDWLEERFPFADYTFDLSPFDAGDRRSILKVFEAMEIGIVENNGIARCLCYCIEVMQHPGTYGDYRFDE